MTHIGHAHVPSTAMQHQLRAGQRRELRENGLIAGTIGGTLGTALAFAATDMRVAHSVARSTRFGIVAGVAVAAAGLALLASRHHTQNKPGWSEGFPSGDRGRSVDELADTIMWAYDRDGSKAIDIRGNVANGLTSQDERTRVSHGLGRTQLVLDGNLGLLAKERGYTAYPQDAHPNRSWSRVSGDNLFRAADDGDGLVTRRELVATLRTYDSAANDEILSHEDRLRLAHDHPETHGPRNTG